MIDTSVTRKLGIFVAQFVSRPKPAADLGEAPRD